MEETTEETIVNPQQLVRELILELINTYMPDQNYQILSRYDHVDTGRSVLWNRMLPALQTTNNSNIFNISISNTYNASVPLRINTTITATINRMAIRTAI